MGQFNSPSPGSSNENSPEEWPVLSGSDRGAAGSLERAPTIADLASIRFLEKDTVLIAPNRTAGVFDCGISSQRFGNLLLTQTEKAHFIIDYSDDSGDLDGMRSQLVRLYTSTEGAAFGLDHQSSPLAIIIDPKGWIAESLESLGIASRFEVFQCVDDALASVGVSMQSVDEAAARNFFNVTAPQFERSLAEEVSNYRGMQERISRPLEPSLAGNLTRFELTDSEIRFSFRAESLDAGGIPESGDRYHALRAETAIVPLAALAQDRELVFDMRGVSRVGDDTIGVFLKLRKTIESQRALAKKLEGSQESGDLPADDVKIYLRNVSPAVRNRIERLRAHEYGIVMDDEHLGESRL
ncbi:MAG: anti-sigma factor antagonist [Bdellovibrionales bacterium]|nr:anti-sigma factor antagonist [Bdellovibrionales bacterium]